MPRHDGGSLDDHDDKDDDDQVHVKSCLCLLLAQLSERYYLHCFGSVPA